MKKQNKKEQILILLEQLKIASTGKISSKIKSNAYRTSELLEELLKEKLVSRIPMNKMTFWELR